MKRRPSTYIHKPDLYVFDEHIVERRPVLPLVKCVVFRFRAPKAKRVRLVGKFTGEGFKSYLMKRTVDGYWECSVELKRGHHEYHFLVDGTPQLDPKAIARVSDDLGGFHSVVEVG
ncbi:MAG TPA: glycogen-binding domain-containing protein [Verrucomicrobiae bacterium]|nr:glycogen-binding domain-containing protein [Verrucomicrobiae bacterium]